MQRDRDDRDLRDYRERDRFPPPPPDSSARRSSSFLHGLPPPISVTPRGYYPPSPSVREAPSPGGLTDPSSWSSHHSPSITQSDLRPSPSRHGRSPPLSSASPRFGDRLPPLSSEYPSHPQGPTRHSWEHPALPSMPYVKAEPSFRPQSRPDFDAAPHDGTGSIMGHPPTDVPVEAPIISVSTPRPPGASRPQTAPSSSRSSSSKHGVPAASGGEAEPPKKKKRRQAFSCAECAKRKQKCNRETPCQHCVSRKVPHLCVPSARLGSPPARPKPKAEGETASRKTETATTSPVPSGALSGRVSKLEKMLNAVLNRVDGLDSSALTEWRQSHPLPTSPPPIRPALETRPASGSSLTSVATGTRNDSEQSEEWVGRSERGPERPSDKVPLGLDFHGPPQERLERIVAEGGEGTLREAYQYLPPKDTADKLVAFFFDKVNYIHYPIDQRLFRQAYEAAYESRGEVSTSVLSLPLILAVMAIAMRLIAEDWAGPNGQKRTASLALFWQALASMSTSTAINAENLQLVEARILLGLYLILIDERRLVEGWLQFRAAIALGQAMSLHRDGSRLGLDPYVVEHRRRLWSYLCHADAKHSLLLGRPLTIDARFYDTELPSNINIDDIVGVTLPTASKPYDEPTFATFLILRHKLADIVFEMISAFQTLRMPMTYTEVQAFDARLQQFRSELPPHYHITQPDKSKDSDLAYLAVHRYLLHSELLHFITILHRPWFLKQGETHALSSDAIIDATIEEFNLRKSFSEENVDYFDTQLGKSFREFSTAMFAAISLITKPRSSRSADLMKIVMSFVDSHPDDGNDETDKDTTIIHTLYLRAKVRRESSDMDLDTETPHPLQENESFERGGGPLAAAAAGDSPSDAKDTTPKPTTDELQDMFNHFLSVNAESLSWNAMTGMPTHEPQIGLLGVSNLRPQSEQRNAFASDPWLAFGALPQSLSESTTTRDVNSRTYWEQFADLALARSSAVPAHMQPDRRALTISPRSLYGAFSAL